MAARDGPLGLADAAVRLAGYRRPDAPPAGRGTGRRRRLRLQPAGSAAGRAGRESADAGSRSRVPDRRQGRGGRRHRQGGRLRHHLPAPAAQPLGCRPGHPAEAGRHPSGRAGVDRQRDGIAGDRQAGRRTDRTRAGLGEGRRVGGRRLGLFGLGLRLRRTARAGRVDPRRGLDCPPAAGSAGRTGQDRPEVDRRRPVSARPRRSRCWPSRWTLSSRTV